MKFITITGIDKAGKTTLINAFMEATGYEHYVIDRSPDTYCFFNVLRNRVKDPNQIDRYFEFNKKFKDVLDLAVLIYADPKDIRERFIEHDEPPLVGEFSVRDHMILLEDYFNIANYNNTLKLNTSFYSIDECVEMIKEKINAT